MNLNSLLKLSVALTILSGVVSAQIIQDSTLLASWTFERGFDRCVSIDESGFGHHILIVGNHQSAIGLSGPYGKCLDFGAGLKTIVRESESQFNSTIFSFAAFINTKIVSKVQTIFQSASIINSVYSGYQIQLGSDSRPKIIFGDSASASWDTITTSAVIPVNSTKHIAITYDGSVVKTYLDGRIASTDSYTRAFTPGKGSAVVGASLINGKYSSFYTEKIDEIKVYNRVLTEQEIHALAFPPKPTVNGCWNVTQEGPGSGYTGTMELTQTQSGSISGTITWNSEFGSAPVSGTINGSIFSVTATFTSPYTITVTYTGTISSDTMTITGGKSSDSHGGLYNFSASKVDCNPEPPESSTQCWQTHQRKSAGSSEWWLGFMQVDVDRDGNVTGGTIDWDVPSHGEIRSGRISGTSATVIAWFASYNLEVTYSGTLSADGAFVTNGTSLPGPYDFQAEKITCP